jgi:hypothetical protein
MIQVRPVHITAGTCRRGAWPLVRQFVRSWMAQGNRFCTPQLIPVYDDLKRVYPDIEPFKFTPHSKTEVVQRLIVAIEQRRVAWPGPSRRPVPEMQAAFCAESGGVILPHPLCSPESRVHEYSGTRDAARLGQADTAISSSPRGNSGQQNAACGLPHPAEPDVS